MWLAPGGLLSDPVTYATNAVRARLGVLGHPTVPDRVECNNATVEEDKAKTVGAVLMAVGELLLLMKSTHVVTTDEREGQA